MKKEIEAFVNAASEQELEAAWNNLSAEEQRVFEQLMEEDPPVAAHILHLAITQIICVAYRQRLC